jgi:WD40 repeat protein/serine/threonine protein kinase
VTPDPNTDPPPDDRTLFTPPPDGASPPGSPSLERPGDRVGPYRLIEPLGEGGFGAVWLAERREPFVQQVALKIVKAGMDSKAVVARFEQERQALAVMNHPHVAKVLDGGITATGRPYFAMEFVRGEPITDFCDRHRLDLRARLEVFLQVCDAVQHAHTKGIIHRDLKPSNVLVAMADADRPAAKVIDFGIAKAVTGRMTEQTVFTETGQMIGTPEYMSPEQADPGAVDIDTRTDVYSLGVLLYELLAGVLPFDPKELRSKAYREIQRIIREDDPPAPSDRLSTVATRDAARAGSIAKARRDQPPALAATLKRELEWIPLKAMRKDRQERYPSPGDLARDVANYLEGRPLVAAPESTAYRVRKYVRRNRGFVAAASIVLASLVVGLGLATWQWREATANERRAIDEAAAADRAREAATASEAVAVKARDAATASEASAVAARKRAEDLLYGITLRNAFDALERADITMLQRELGTARTLGGASRFPFRFAEAVADQSSRLFRPWAMGAGPGAVTCIALSPTGDRLATGGHEGVVRVWNTSDWSSTGIAVRVHEQGQTEVQSIAFSPDGTILASASSRGVLRLWDSATGASIGDPIVTPRSSRNRFQSVAFGPDGRLLAWTATDAQVRLLDVRSRTLHAVLSTPTSESASTDVKLNSIEFSPDGSKLAAACHRGTIYLWDFKTGAARSFAPGNGMTYDARWSPDGKCIAAAGGDGSIQLWDPVELKPIGERMNGHAMGVSGVAFSPDGRVLASTSWGRNVRLWDVATRKALGGPLLGHADYVINPLFSPSGEFLFTLVPNSRDGVRVWDVGAALTDRRWPDPEFFPGIERIALVSGETFPSAIDRYGARRWDPRNGRAIGAALRVDKGARFLATSTTGHLVATHDAAANTIRLTDLNTGGPVFDPYGPGAGEIRTASFSPDGKVLAVAERGMPITLWAFTEREQESKKLRGHAEDVIGLAFTAEGTRLVSWTSEPDPIHVWDVEAGTLVGTVPSGNSEPAVSGDGKLLAYEFLDDTTRTVVVWDLSTFERVGEPLVGANAPLAFCPDGRTLVADGRLWDVPSQIEIGGLSTAAIGECSHYAFDPAGRFLVASDWSSTYLIHSDPLRDRAPEIRRRLRRVEDVRPRIERELAALGHTDAELFTYQTALSLPGRLQPADLEAALAVIGRFDIARDVAHARAAEDLRKQRQQPLDAAIAARDAGDWAGLLRLVATTPAEDFWNEAGFWNEVAWRGLTELPVGAPERDLDRILQYAERAVQLSKRADGAVLDTLARAHWELGDGQRAREVQSEAVKAAEASLAGALERLASAKADPAEIDAFRESMKGMIAELRDTLARYQRDEPPSPRSATGPAHE